MGTEGNRHFSCDSNTQEWENNAIIYINCKAILWKLVIVTFYLVGKLKPFLLPMLKKKSSRFYFLGMRNKLSSNNHYQNINKNLKFLNCIHAMFLSINKIYELL